MKIKAFFLIGVIVLLIGDVSEGALTKKVLQEQEKSAAVEKKINPEPIGWTYRTATVGIDNTELSFAEIRSNNTIDLPFPYAGVNHGQITIRKIKKGRLDVLFLVDKGQFVASTYPDGYGIQLKADDGKTKYYTGYKPDSGATGVLTFYGREASQIVDAIKEAKIVKISTDVYKSGPKVFEFNAEGLDIKKVDPDY